MTSIRQRRVAKVLGVFGLGLGLSLATACKKDEAAKTPAAGGDKSAEASGGVSGGGAKASTGDDLSLLPVDSEIVIGLNFAQIRDSALWKQFVEPKLMSGSAQTKLAEFKAKCPGFDPMNSFTSMSIGMKNTSTSPSVVVVAHGIDKAKALECMDKNKEEIASHGNEITRDGDVTLVKGKQPEDQTAILFVNDNTAIAMVGDGASASGVKALAAGGSALKTSPAFVDMYKKVKTSDSLWALASGKALDQMPMVKATAVYGSFNVTDGLAMDLRLRLDTPDAATQMASMATAQAQQAKAFVDKADFTAEGNEMHASVVMSSQKLQTLISQVGPMLRGLMGNMGSK